MSDEVDPAVGAEVLPEQAKQSGILIIRIGTGCWLAQREDRVLPSLERGFVG